MLEDIANEIILDIHNMSDEEFIKEMEQEGGILIIKDEEMNLLELNIKLKEELSILEKMYKELYDSYLETNYVPSMIHGNLKILSLMCSEQLKAQRGEQSSQIKFNTVEEFASYIGNMTNITLEYLEDKYNIK